MVNISLKREKKSHLISGEEDEGLVYIRFKQVKMAPIYTRVKKIKKKTKKNRYWLGLHWLEKGRHI